MKSKYKTLRYKFKIGDYNDSDIMFDEIKQEAIKEIINYIKNCKDKDNIVIIEMIKELRQEFIK